MSTKIRTLVVTIGADTTNFNQKMKMLSSDLKSMGKKFNSVGSTLTKGITLPAVGAAVGLATLAIKAGQTADELLTLSAQTGIATDTLQKMKYASELVDVSVETMTKGLAKVTKATGSAVKKGQDYIETTNGLKIGIKDSNGQLLKSEDIFYKAIDAIGSLKNETDKEIAAQELFGKSYQELMPLIKAGGKSIKEYGEEAKKMGLIMSDAEVEALGKFDDSMVRLKATMGLATSKIAVALLPALEKLIPVIQDKLVPWISEMTDKFAKAIEKFLEMDEGTQKLVLGIVGVSVALGPVLKGLGTILTTGSQVAKILSAIGTAAGTSGAAGGMAATGTAATAAAGGMATFGASLTALLAPIAAVTAGLGGLLYLSYKLSKEDPLKNPNMWNNTAKLNIGTANNLLGGKAGGMGDFKVLDSYATGTPYVPKTGLYQLHEGEAVIPANQNGTEMKHSGTIRVEGVNNRGELVAVGNIIVKNLKFELAREERRNR